jgi:hypothetical protein
MNHIAMKHLTSALKPYDAKTCHSNFATMPNLVEQIREVLSMFARANTKPALIGGLAVVAHGVVRTTQDVDFLLKAEAG